MSPLLLLAQASVPTWVVIVGPVLAIGAVVVGVGRVLQRLDDVREEHKAARTESKAQHEETRREIATLREARVASDATVEHLRADLDALKDAVRDVRSDVAARDRAQTDARHDQTNAFAATLRQMVDAALAEREAARAPRRARGGR